MQIIPAIIPKSFEDLGEKMSALVGLVPLVQVDVLDGSLVPHVRAFPYQSTSKSDANFEKIIREEIGFPFWKKLEFEAHLMVREPERIIADWIAAGASRIIVQYEGVGNFDRCVEAVTGRVPLGVSIALDTPREALASIADHVEVIQCMGWNFSSLGRQGESFDPRAIEAVSELRQLYPEHIISVDGGVNLENAPALGSAGAVRLVVGSAIWKDGMVRDNLENFIKITKE